MPISPELMWGVGLVVLVLALVWGVRQSQTRNRANDRVAEKATEDLYQDPQGYDRDKPKFDQQARSAPK